jgi:hypothetical protein
MRPVTGTNVHVRIELVEVNGIKVLHISSTAV